MAAEAQCSQPGGIVGILNAASDQRRACFGPVVGHFGERTADDTQRMTTQECRPDDVAPSAAVATSGAAATSLVDVRSALR